LVVMGTIRFEMQGHEKCYTAMDVASDEVNSFVVRNINTPISMKGLK
jgi:hypothetical protein